MKPFAERVNIASRIIREGRNPGRSFSTCFEEGDGDQVMTAIVDRAYRFEGRLLANLSRYFTQTSIERAKTLSA